MSWVASVTAHGLPGAHVDVPDEPLSDAAWKVLIREVRYQRAAGFLAGAIRSLTFPATEEQATEAAELHANVMAQALLLECSLLDVVDQLAEVGVDYRVLKGSAVAHLDYADPSIRSFGDIDLLVRSEHWDAAVRTLVRTGNKRLLPSVRKGWDRRFAKGTVFRMPTGEELDLHRTLALGPFGLTVDLADAWRRSSVFLLAGRQLQALADEERFLHACLHAVLGDAPPRLTALRDIAQIHLSRSLDAGVLLDLTARWRSEAVVGTAVTMTWKTFGLGDVTWLSEWARRQHPDPAQLRALSLYLERGRDTYAALCLAGVRAIPRWRDKAAYVAALAVPDRNLASGKPGGNMGRWRLAARLLHRQ